jgi:hypothetical protein
VAQARLVEAVQQPQVVMAKILFYNMTPQTLPIL